MNPWIGKALILAGSIAMIVIRAPHGQRSRSIEVVTNRRGALDTSLLVFGFVAFLVPLIWIVTPGFAFADYPLRPAPLLSGTACLVLGLWIFARSHADLGRNWSITLELRKGHELVTRGIYRHVRHPMYLGLLVYSAGQLLVVPNWIAGPSYGVATILLFVFRVGAEERMMVDRFGEQYEIYRARTKRLVPRVW